MSASSKKKLRKEQSSEMLTEKQQQERAEAKKLKTYTIIFVAVIAVVVVIALGTLISGIVTRSGVMEKNTVAAKVGDQELNSVEMSYYYTDAVSGAVNKWKSSLGDMAPQYMASVGLTPGKPLADQIYDKETNETWAHHFMEQGLDKAKADYAVSAKAEAEGYKLSDEEKEALDYNYNMMGTYAQMSGFPNMKEYLKTVYGHGATEASYKAYIERSALAQSYYNSHRESLEYTDEDLSAYDAEHTLDFNSYTYNVYTLPLSSYKEGDGKDPQILAEADAKILTQATTVEELNKAIAELGINKDKENAASQASNDVLYPQVSTVFKDWIADSSRQAGDITYFPQEQEKTNEDGETVKELTGYIVVRFESVNDNKTQMNDVRHILVQFKDGTKGEDGKMVYSDEAKADAKAKAEEILARFNGGEKTEDAFAALAKELSEDGGSKDDGGLIAGIMPDSMYVENFRAWAVDEARKVGDTDIVETEYGYHVMYYVGVGEHNYREAMIENTLMTNDMNAWYDSIMEAVTAELVDTSRVNPALAFN